VYRLTGVQPNRTSTFSVPYNRILSLFAQLVVYPNPLNVEAWIGSQDDQLMGDGLATILYRINDPALAICNLAESTTTEMRANSSNLLRLGCEPIHRVVRVPAGLGHP
jgi:hypothetical protein